MDGPSLTAADHRQRKVGHSWVSWAAPMSRKGASLASTAPSRACGSLLLLSAATACQQCGAPGRRAGRAKAIEARGWSDGARRPSRARQNPTWRGDPSLRRRHAGTDNPFLISLIPGAPLCWWQRRHARGGQRWSCTNEGSRRPTQRLPLAAPAAAPAADTSHPPLPPALAAPFPRVFSSDYMLMEQRGGFLLERVYRPRQGLAAYRLPAGRRPVAGAAGGAQGQRRQAGSGGCERVVLLASAAAFPLLLGTQQAAAAACRLGAGRCAGQRRRRRCRAPPPPPPGLVPRSQRPQPIPSPVAFRPSTMPTPRTWHANRQGSTWGRLWAPGAHKGAQPTRERRAQAGAPLPAAGTAHRPPLPPPCPPRPPQHAGLPSAPSASTSTALKPAGWWTGVWTAAGWVGSKPTPRCAAPRPAAARGRGSTAACTCSWQHPQAVQHPTAQARAGGVVGDEAGRVVAGQQLGARVGVAGGGGRQAEAAGHQGQHGGQHHDLF